MQYTSAPQMQYTGASPRGSPPNVFAMPGSQGASGSHNFAASSAAAPKITYMQQPQGQGLPASHSPMMGGTAHSPALAQYAPATALTSAASLASRPSQIDNQMALARPEDVKRHVAHALGRIIPLPGNVAGIAELMSVLRVQLGLPDQMFELQDCNGAPLLHDDDVDACLQENRTPIMATVPEDSNLAVYDRNQQDYVDMMKKFAKTQHEQALTKLSSFSRQLGNFETAYGHFKDDLERRLDQNREELMQQLEINREESRAESHRLEQMIQATQQAVDTERSMREVAVHSGNTVVSGMGQNMDDDRAAVQQETTLTRDLIQQVNQKVQQEAITRAAFEDRIKQDMQSLKDVLLKTESAMKADVEHHRFEFKKSAEIAATAVESHGNTVTHARTNMDLKQADFVARLKLIEDRSRILEERMHHTETWHAENSDRTQQRTETFSSEVEKVKLKHSEHGGSIDVFLQRLQDMEAETRAAKQDARESAEQNRAERDEEMSSFSEHMVSQVRAMMQQMEADMHSKIDGEATNRQQHVSEMMENVAGAMKNSTAVSAPPPAPASTRQVSAPAAPNVISSVMPSPLANMPSPMANMSSPMASSRYSGQPGQAMPMSPRFAPGQAMPVSYAGQPGQAMPMKYAGQPGQPMPMQVAGQPGQMSPKFGQPMSMSAAVQPVQPGVTYPRGQNVFSVPQADPLNQTR